MCFFTQFLSVFYVSSSVLLHRLEKNALIDLLTDWLTNVVLRGRQKIEGEVYDVDDQFLAFMDHFEGHPEVYSRDKVQAHFLGPPASSSGVDSDSFECWTYFLKGFSPELLYKETTGVYDGYSSKPYQPESVCSSLSAVIFDKLCFPLDCFDFI